MLDKQRFEFMTHKYGKCSSWAVWAVESLRSKDNVGDLSIFDPVNIDNLLPLLQPQFVFIGLNFAERNVNKPLANFHDPSSHAMDYKIRYALKDTQFYGAYLTDVIKGFHENNSKSTMKYLQKNPHVEKENINLLEEEISDLGVSNPVLIAFGIDSYKILQRNLSRKYKILKILHYSHHISKVNYRVEVLNQLTGL